MKQLRRIEGERGLDKIFAASGKRGIKRIVIPRSGATRNLLLPATSRIRILALPRDQRLEGLSSFSPPDNLRR
jgi:hypothetical protein